MVIEKPEPFGAPELRKGFLSSEEEPTDAIRHKLVYQCVPNNDLAADQLVLDDLKSGCARVGIPIGDAINLKLKQAVDFVILKGGSGPVGKRVAWQYVGRYALIALTLYVTIRFSLLSPALIVAGLLVYVLAILLESVFEVLKSF